MRIESYREGELQKQEPASHFTVLLPHRFSQDFQVEGIQALDSIPDNRSSLGIETMWVEFYGQKPKGFFNIAKRLAEQGFETEIHLDAYSEQILDGRYLLFPPLTKKQRDHWIWVSGFTRKRLQLLKEKGAYIEKTHPIQNPFEKATFLITRRNHKKIFYITHGEKMVAWIGGMNLAKLHFSAIDCMVKLTDRQIVTKLIEEFKRTSKDPRTTSEEVPCTSDTSILVDSGIDKSKILEKAIEYINSAKESIYVISQFHPRGEYLAVLNKARRRGVHIAYITSDPTIESTFLKGVNMASDLIASATSKRIPLLLTKGKSVHAKAQVVDEKVVIVGSHNFVDGPHEELSLRSENPTLVNNVVLFFEGIAGEHLRRPLEKDFILPTAA